MTDLFEVMSLGHIAITFADGGAFVTCLSQEPGEDGDPVIDRKIFSDDDALCTFVRAYARRMFETPETIEDALRGKRKRER